ncbi:hypothetical protein DPMN_024187 [Dreissena polymorpha]|uniref:Uncharacterized protein n=1 Tax=Dreissena polymorpha TaxID=45954 RepID=A0A9D4LM11_DREPO|nr:hypothetical protein DPMN_024187 [Dreissena polymorpha]
MLLKFVNSTYMQYEWTAQDELPYATGSSCAVIHLCIHPQLHRRFPLIYRAYPYPRISLCRLFSQFLSLYPDI